MNKILALGLCLFSTLALADHDSSVNLQGINRSDCLTITRMAQDLLTQNHIGFVMNSSCSPMPESTSAENAMMTVIDAHLMAKGYDVTGVSNECDNNMQLSLQALQAAGKIAFISTGCDYTDPSSNSKAGVVTVISEYENL